MDLPEKIRLLLKDRESGSVALLNQLMATLEEILHTSDPQASYFQTLLSTLRRELGHFAAIDDFLFSIMSVAYQGQTFPGSHLRFMEEYRLYWQGSGEQIAAFFLQGCNPEGKTILTHSHSHTVISLLEALSQKQISFRVLQTLSVPGEEGRISWENMRRMQIQAELTDETNIRESLAETDLILVGCDALLPAEFFNKVGTRAILELAKQRNIPTFLVTESRKQVTRADWIKPLSFNLFEWIPLTLIDHVVSEKGLQATH